MLEFKEVTYPEKSRTYRFPSGNVTVDNVVRVCARTSGSHRLETKDGSKVIIPSGFLAIQIEAKKWSF